jgi:hypothetical protein
LPYNAQGCSLSIVILNPVVLSSTKSRTSRLSMDGNIAVKVEMPEEPAAASEVPAKRIARWTGNENQVDTAIPSLRLSR